MIETFATVNLSLITSGLRQTHSAIDYGRYALAAAAAANSMQYKRQAWEALAIAYEKTGAYYLFKPVDANDLAAALKKLDEAKPVNAAKERLTMLFDNLNGRKKRITVPTENELLFFPVADILHCRSNINHTTIYLKDKQKIVVAKTLKNFEMLADDTFFRIHNLHLTNLTYVTSYIKGIGGSVHLTDDTEPKVSTHRKKDLLARLNQTQPAGKKSGMVLFLKVSPT